MNIFKFILFKEFFILFTLNVYKKPGIRLLTLDFGDPYSTPFSGNFDSSSKVIWCASDQFIPMKA